MIFPLHQKQAVFIRKETDFLTLGIDDQRFIFPVKPADILADLSLRWLQLPIPYRLESGFSNYLVVSPIAVRHNDQRIFGDTVFTGFITGIGAIDR